MIAVAAGTLLVLLLPFLPSLAGQATMPKVLCLVASLLALLLSVDKFAAVLPWSIGMAIAVISVRRDFVSADRFRGSNATRVQGWAERSVPTI
jgi:hypothetical protein